MSGAFAIGSGSPLLDVGECARRYHGERATGDVYKKAGQRGRSRVRTPELHVCRPADDLVNSALTAGAQGSIATLHPSPRAPALATMVRTATLPSLAFLWLLPRQAGEEQGGEHTNDGLLHQANDRSRSAHLEPAPLPRMDPSAKSAATPW